MMRFLSYLRPAAVIGPLPVTLVNGTVPDANQVMADFNWIVNQVNTNVGQGGGASKNYLVNGSMLVFQRGGGASNQIVVAGTRAYTLDRWQGVAGSGQTATFVQEPINTLGQFQYAMVVARPGGGTATTAIQVGQSLETTDSIPLQGQNVTLSFWAIAGSQFSPTSYAVTVAIVSGTGTDENVFTPYTGSYNVASQVISLNNSWARYSISGAVPANATEIGVTFSISPTGTAGTQDNFMLAGVQLEVATSPSTFDFEPYGTTLQRCFRYYQKSFPYSTKPAEGSSGAGYNWQVSALAGSVSNVFTTLILPVPLRYVTGTPVTIYNVTGTSTGQLRDSTISADYTSSAGHLTPAGSLYFVGTSPSGQQVGDLIYYDWTAECEL